MLIYPRDILNIFQRTPSIYILDRIDITVITEGTDTRRQREHEQRSRGAQAKIFFSHPLEVPAVGQDAGIIRGYK